MTYKNYIRSQVPVTRSYASFHQPTNQSRNNSNRSTFGQPDFLLTDADIQMLENILLERRHDNTYKACVGLIVTLIDSYVRFEVDHELKFLFENGCSTETIFTRVGIMTAAIESNQTTVVNWLTSRIKDHGVYRQAIMAIGKSQHEESKIMLVHALKQG